MTYLKSYCLQLIKCKSRSQISLSFAYTRCSDIILKPLSSQLTSSFILSIYEFYQGVGNNNQPYFMLKASLTSFLFMYLVYFSFRHLSQLLFLLPNVHGEFRVQCLEILHGSISNYENIFLELKSKGLLSFLNHRQVEFKQSVYSTFPTIIHKGFVP